MLICGRKSDSKVAHWQRCDPLACCIRLFDPLKGHRFIYIVFDVFRGAAMSGPPLTSNQFVQTFGTDEYPSFDEALRVFLKQAGDRSKSISSCCLAVAGPVVDNKCVMTNLKWVVDGRAVTQEFGFRTAVCAFEYPKVLMQGPGLSVYFMITAACGKPTSALGMCCCSDILRISLRGYVYLPA
jgi:Glucokinase